MAVTERTDVTVIRHQFVFQSFVFVSRFTNLKAKFTGQHPFASKLQPCNICSVDLNVLKIGKIRHNYTFNTLCNSLKQNKKQNKQKYFLIVA